jgi:hypothetical protein
MEDNNSENDFQNSTYKPYYRYLYSQFVIPIWYTRKKVFVPPLDPNYDPIKEQQKQQEAEEHRKALGREVNTHHFISSHFDLGPRDLSRSALL